MANLGWGSPTTVIPQSGYHGFGWGSPTPPAGPQGLNIDPGWGAPVIIAEPVIESAEGAVDRALYSDEGGELIELAATWPISGPYRARIRNQNALEFPQPSYCYGAVVSKGFELYAVGENDLLRFALPPAPPGRYDIVVRFGAGYNDTVIVQDAIRIMRRNRSAATYRLRFRLPPRWQAGTGAALAEQEPRLTGGA